MSIMRHRAEHLAPLLARAYDAEEVSRAGALVSELRSSIGELRGDLRSAIDTGDYLAVASIANAALRGFELRADLEAERRRRDTLAAQAARYKARARAAEEREKRDPSVRPPGYDAMIAALRRVPKDDDQAAG